MPDPAPIRNDGTGVARRIMPSRDGFSRRAALTCRLSVNGMFGTADGSAAQCVTITGSPDIRITFWETEPTKISSEMPRP